ncbi:anti-sigma factor [Actinomadura sp. WMMB 499]|uniref:anti-sigma factor n=1 Tax=Actinomadura sp. WMMB 499 TaxID=1219491 RepID=UPI001244E07B|nr:anti-sigma factor [Actinomadura sp. WMMB 499]QFG20916.1 hypothetical protein F7P10_06940 [Actinomadura sp. WMMB 499]
MTHDLHDLGGAYALDALEETERRRFERHLDRCPSCAEEVRGLRETTSRLAVAAARRPPDRLRERVLAEIGRTRQLPPRPARRPRAVRTRHSPWLVAAACLVLAVLGGTFAVRSHQEAEQAQALNRRIAAVLAAPDARTSTAPVPGSAPGSVTVVASRSLNRAVVTTHGLAPVPGDRTYQLWLLGREAPLPSALLAAPPGEPSPPVITSGLAGIRTIGLTVEPAGGSARPSSAPIVTVPLG